MSAAPARVNPFPGLRPFTQEEDYLFFGREEQTIELLQRLGGNRFVAVVGTSGSGKSSLVRCGLLSQLRGGKMLGAGASWAIAVTHPGGNPLALLTDALLEAGLYDREEVHARENLLATLSRSHLGLIEAVKQAGLGEGTNFLLVVDQFEEIFRFHEGGQAQQEAANEFVSLLLEAAAQKEVPIYVVLTMRSDFIGECGQFEGLAEMVNRGEFLIPRLTREQYKRIIEGPIKVAGGQVAPRLLQRLLNDLGQQADQLPCLQHALMRTWNVWAGNGDTEALDLDDYQRVGKMSQALSLHADEIYHSLASDRQRALCQGIFQALTVEEANSRGIRRPQRLGRLCQILEVPAEELLPIIDAYRQSGVTFLMPSPEVELADQTIIDISHESLMRVWTRLRQWVEEETQAAGIYYRLSESATLHAQAKAGLYRDPELGIALAWRESKQPNAAWAERYRPGFATAMGFLEASQQASVAEEQAREAARQRELEQAQQLAEARQLRLEQQQRAARKLRKLIAGVAVVAVIAAIAGAAALVARNEASKLAQIADAEAEKARKNAQQAEQSRQETVKALGVIESQKAKVEGSLSKAEAAERQARAAEEAGRKLLYTTDMRLAPFLWGDDRTTAQKLRILLARHNPDSQVTGDTDALRTDKKRDLRGFEWHYYQHLLNSSAAVFSGHGASVVAGAFTSDGQLVTLDQSGQVRRWDLDSQAEDQARRRDLPIGRNAQLRVLSPDGRLAALALGNKVYVFDTSTGKEQFQVDSAPNFARRLIFTPDSGRLVIVDDKIRWCAAASGQVIASVNQQFNRGSSLALSADGRTLAVVGHGPLGNQFSIFRLDAATRTVTPQAQDVGPFSTLGAAGLSPDGRLIAVGAKLYGAVSVFDTITGRLIAQHASAHASDISALTFSGDGAKLVTADIEGTIKIWQHVRQLTSKSAAAMTLKGHEAAITHVGLASAGKHLVSTGADRTARVWDLEHTGTAIRVLERSGTRCYAARFSPDGHLIAAADGNRVRLWDAATGKLVRLLSAAAQGRVYSVAFSPTDHRLLAVGYGEQADVSQVALWDIDAGRELARLPGATGEVGALAFSPGGKYLVAGFGSPRIFSTTSFPNPLKVWDVATRRVIRHLSGHTGYCVSLDFSRDGARLASGSQDGTAIIWSTRSWKALHTLRNPDPGTYFFQGRAGMVDDVAFSPNGKTLALASREGTVQLWNVAGGKLLKTLRGHSNAVSAVAFSPDGRTLATGGADKTVRLWNVETRRELMQLDPGKVELGDEEGGVETLAFSPDGKHLLAGGYGRTAFWSTAPIVWNDPERGAQKLQLLRHSNADFPSRIRMLSENLRLHEALAKLDPKDGQVQAARAATRANWHAAHRRWAEAAKEYDRLQKLSPDQPQSWLRTPGLIRVATALFHEGRPALAATLLTGGAQRRTQDGLPPVTKTDRGTGERWRPLLAAINERLIKDPKDAALLELRAELAGQWSDTKAQLADYTAAIDALSQQNSEAAVVDRKRLYGRRGKASLAFAPVAYAQKKYAFATRLWAEALASDPKLGDEPLTQHRYHAARAAVLAAAGQGQDEPPLDDAAKAKLRRQALDWLKAERAAWAKRLESGPLQDRPSVLQAMGRWRWDSDLAGIRAKAALAKLSVEEQKAFAQLWADVAKATEPANNAERLALAQVAFDHKRFAVTARLWAEALANDPKLADDRQAQPRYHAARAAALAADGQGSGEPPLQDTAKAKLRCQALDWLKAELTALDRLPESSWPQARPWNWRTDTALVRIRDAAALAKLPAAEQKQWQAFWAEVEGFASSGDHYQRSLARFRQGKLDQAITEARTAIRRRPDFAEAHYFLGNALSEQGKLDEAITEYRTVIRRRPDFAEAYCNLGFVLHRQGDYVGALDMRRKGHDLGSRRPDWRYPSALWVAQAERALSLSKRLPALLRGQDKPANNAERVAFAQIAYNQKKFTAATRLWAEAMTSDPKLGDHRQIQSRYNAAGAAALAAAGQGKDEPPLAEAAKAKLRRQALDWLKTELTVWDKLLASGPLQARPFIVRTLSHWQKDTDLAGIRDKAALAKLPPEERKAFTQLWADVAALLNKAEQKPK